MILRQLFDHKTWTYSYLIADESSRRAIIIDAVLDNVDQYLQLLKELKLQLDYAIDTHTHADHITAMGVLRDKTGCVTLVGRQSSAQCASGVYGHGDILRVGIVELEVRYTPGHTDDSYSFYLPQAGMVFTGDTLLIRGSGRTDFQSGDAKEQYLSLQEQLLSLPGETIVYPGHDYRGWSESTIAEELAHNPRLQVASVDDYADIMNNLNLPHPAMMDVAVPANIGCGKK